MGILNFLKGQLLEIIEWNDDSRDTLSFRFPDDDKEIKRGAQLIVRESQLVQFVYLGEFADTFGPGKHTLNTDNIPILTTLKSWKYGFVVSYPEGKEGVTGYAPEAWHIRFVGKDVASKVHASGLTLHEYLLR